MITWLLPLLFWLSVGLIGYHLLGYPLLLAVVARLRKPKKRGDAFSPPISVIVPAHNEGGVIREKLLSILNSNYPRDCLEVIVVEDGSTDDTAAQVLAVAASDARVTLDSSPVRGGKTAALNRAIRRAKADFLVFTDANAMLKPDTLRNLIGCFADERVGFVSGRKTVQGSGDVERNENAYWRYEAWIKRMESRIGSTPAAAGELMAVRRALYSVPANHIINDDFSLACSTARQGFRVLYDHSAVTVEAGSGTLADEYGRKSRIAAGRWQQVGQVLGLAGSQPWFVFAFISHKLLRLLVFPLLALALVSNVAAALLAQPGDGTPGALLALQGPWAALLLGGQALFYALAGLGGLLHRFGVRVKPLYFLYYFLSAQAAAVSGLLRFSSGKQTVLWRKVAR